MRQARAISAAVFILCVSNGAFAQPDASSYSALNFEDKKCEIRLPRTQKESGIFCGKSISRENILRSTSFDSKRCEGWGRYCATEIFRHSLVYREGTPGEAATLAFYFVNKNASDRFTEDFAAWLENAKPRPMQWEKGI
jgi:hypothetical protein